MTHNEDGNTRKTPELFINDVKDVLCQYLKKKEKEVNVTILYICNNVRLYFISSEDRVSGTHKPNKLFIVKVHDEVLDSSERTFLQVGSFIYPLISEVSHYKTENGAFIFPNVTAKIKNAAVKIILPKKEVHEFIQFLNEILYESKLGLRGNEVNDLSENDSSEIVRAANYASESLLRGATSTARFLNNCTPLLINRIPPHYEPQQVDPKFKKAVEVAKVVTGYAAGITDFFATKIYTATTSLVKHLSPDIQSQGTHFLKSVASLSEEEAQCKMNTVLSVTSNAMEGLNTLCSGLGTAFNIVGESLSSSTVQIVQHKYGKPTGEITSDALTVLGNVYHTYQNCRVLKPKGIAKVAVKSAISSSVLKVKSQN